MSTFCKKKNPPLGSAPPKPLVIRIVLLHTDWIIQRHLSCTVCLTLYYLQDYTLQANSTEIMKQIIKFVRLNNAKFDFTVLRIYPFRFRICPVSIGTYQKGILNMEFGMLWSAIHYRTYISWIPDADTLLFFLYYKIKKSQTIRYDFLMLVSSHFT